ncbi:MAG: LapA family protein [Candidatus Krumholzibacteriales bacterium]
MTGVSRAKMITAIVLGALGIIIVLQNFRDVETRILFWRLTMPHMAVLGIVFAAGLVLGAALAVMYYFRQTGRPEERNRTRAEM